MSGERRSYTVPRAFRPVAVGPSEALLIFTSIFAIVNPVGNVPTYVSLTDGMPTKARVRIRRQVVSVGPPILLLFMFLGNLIFDAFNITLPAFRIAGGILVFKVAFDMLQGQRGSVKWSKHEEADAHERASIGIAPLGVPLYTGPGAISTVMILGAEHPGVPGRATIVAAVLATFALAYLLLKYSDGLFRVLGRSGLLIFSRVIGLLLAAVAVEFIVGGLRASLPGLA